jgi:hypothetical protein
VRQAFLLFFARAQDTRLDGLRRAGPAIVETFTWMWGAACLVLIIVPLPLPDLPRFSLHLFALMNVLLALGAVISAGWSEEERDGARWAGLVLGAAAVRFVLAAALVSVALTSEIGLTIYLVAGILMLLPALRAREFDAFARFKACAKLLDRDFLRFTGAALSVFLGIYLFTGADRIAAVGWMDYNGPQSPFLSAGLPREFDAYQATGLLARGLLWGTQPLLWFLYAERSRIAATTAGSLRFFWIYLAVLIGGALVLGCGLHAAGDRLFPDVRENFGPTFAAVMVPIGLLQALGIFGLASRRYPECFTLGGCGVVYGLVLAWFGRRPEVMLPYMFGGALISLMIVLLVGVVRWGRRQP